MESSTVVSEQPAVASTTEKTTNPQKKHFDKKNKKPFDKKKSGEGSNNNEKKEGESKNLKKPNANNTNPNEPYIFIIKNAENDLCRIHEAALPQFLGLNVKNQEKRKDGASYYEVKIRSETRTGELTFHGKDETAFFRTSGPTPSASGKVNINKKAGQKRGREEEQKKDGETAADPATEGEATAAVDNEAGRFSTIQDMLAGMSDKPYFNNHLTYKLTTGADAANSLMRNLCGAVAEVNKKTNPKGLKKVLKDVPGFLSCWFLKATGPSTSQFRVVFNSENELLSAKEMLDQFEADQGVRVSLKLSDNFQSKFQKFLVEKASGGAESGDVVQLSTHNEDYE